jgi:integrase
MNEQKVTIGDIAKEWIVDKRQYVKQSTISVYALIVENHILPILGGKMELSEDEVQQFALRKINDGLSHKSVKDILVVLKMVMKFGVKRGLTTHVEWKIQFPTEQSNAEIEVYSLENQKRIMRYTQEHFTFRNLGILICFCTGVRIGEVCALTWNDVDIERGVLSVSKTLERIYVMDVEKRHTKLIVDTPKTKNSIREIPLSKELLKILKPLKRIVNASHYVLSNEVKPIEPRTYRNHYKQVVTALGIQPLKFHGMRHSFATRCIESNCDYKTVSVILGHADISTTLNLYVHPNMEHKKKCIDKMMRGLI